MALLNLFYDTNDKRVKASALGAQTYFVDEDFTPNASFTEVTLLNTITAPQKLDVFINGQMVQEGVSFTRNVAQGKIIFTGTMQANAWVRVREWNF